MNTGNALFFGVKLTIKEALLYDTVFGTAALLIQRTDYVSREG